MGTPSRKTEPHQKYSSMAPPTTGPSAMPTENMVTQMAMAMPRWRASANMLLIRASVEGISVAPATPSRARAAISSAGSSA